MNIFKSKFLKNNPARLILFMYIVAIAIGTLLLTLPIASSAGTWTNPIDSLFTITSAICVTGLVTLTTAAHWSLFGKIVIIVWIQLGGLGIMTASTVVALFLNKKLSISERINLSEEKNASSISGIVKIVKYVLLTTFIIEAIGALILSFTFVKDFGWARGIWYSIFHSISAFCNAGFDIIGEISLMPYATNASVSLVIAALIVIAGLGYPVYKDISKYRFKFSRYSLHSKLVLIVTTALLVLPTLIFVVLEFNNPDTLGGYSLLDKIQIAFFQSVTLRTAGFFTAPQGSFINASVILMCVLMFIGGSPASTAGGFKTTSFATLLFITRSNVRKNKDVSIFRRRLPDDLGPKLTTMFTLSMLWILLAIFFLAYFEQDILTLDLAYEVISAYATVGLSRGITPNLTSASKIILVATMIFGKVGPISMITAFIKKDKVKTYREIEENILVG